MIVGFDAIAASDAGHFRVMATGGNVFLQGTADEAATPSTYP
jgi:hypothetical protein